MTIYRISVMLHVAAAMLWLGHMFFWSLFGGPTLKKLDPPPTAARLRELSFWRGGLGWPALAVLAVTGLYQLHWRGLALGELLETASGRLMAGKLVLVAGMVGYQIVFAHHAAPRAIHFNMAAALLVLAASVLLVRG